MAPIDKMIKKFGKIEAIPDEALKEIGLVRYNGEIIRQKTYERIMGTNEETVTAIQLPAAEYGLTNNEFRFKNSKRKVRIDKREEKARGQLEESLEDVFETPLGKSFSGEFKERIRNYSVDWMRDRIEEELPLKISQIPYLRLLQESMKLQDKLPQLPERLKAKILEKSQDLYLKQIEGDLDTLAKGYISIDYININEETVRNAGNEVINTEAKKMLEGEIPENIMKDFEAKYGSVRFCGGAPFKSYAFRRLILEENDPKEFWGRELFEKYKNLVKELGSVPEAQQLASMVYDTEIGDVFGGYIFGDDDYAIKGLEAIKDNLPYPVIEFENRRAKGESAAIAYMSTEPCYCVDDHFLNHNPDIRRMLVAIQRKEKEKAIEAEETRFDFLKTKVKEAGKRNKLSRLAEHNKSFMDWISIHNGSSDYIDSLPKNQETTKELKQIGVDTDLFYRGIEERVFSLEKGEVIPWEKLREGNIADYRTFLGEMLTGNVVRSKENLETKLANAFKDQELGKSQVKDYVLNLEDDEMIRKVCNVAADYASKPQNVKDIQTAGAIAHHLRQVGRFLRGDTIDTSDGGKTNSYMLRISRKNPFTEVDLGNDGGCCIGIYDQIEDQEDERNWTFDSFLSYLEASSGFKEVDPNGCYMPFYLKDRATHFAEIYKGKDRRGLALMFAGKNERDEPVLAINSIELSEKLKEDNNKPKVVEETIKYLKDYAKASGFKYVIMGQHSYNPGRTNTSTKPDFEKFYKIDNWNEEFYADIETNGDLEDMTLVWSYKDNPKEGGKGKIKLQKIFQ